MAVAMEVSSRQGPPELLGSPVPKKRAWGADAQQLMHGHGFQWSAFTSGLIYFKDWNSGTLTSPEHLLQVTTEDAVTTKRKSTELITTPAEDQSLELSLNLPGTPRPGTNQDGSVCTMEKVRSALQRSQWLHRRSSACTPLVQTSTLPSSDPTVTPSVTLSLLSSSNSQCLLRDSGSISESAATSPCSSVGFRSPSVMSFQGDEEEVQQPGDCRDSGAKTQIESPGASGPSSPVMVTVGCKSCLMYVMLSKSDPSCPKCGNTDVLLELPVPLVKKRRLTPVEAPSWNWCTAS